MTLQLSGDNRIVSGQLGVGGPQWNSNGALLERGRSVPMGEWITPAYNAGDFTASGSMTWTVEAADVTTYRYMIIGKTMFLNFYLQTTTTGGTASNALYLKIPGGYTPAASRIWVPISCYPSTGWQTGTADILGGATNIYLYSAITLPNWTLATNNIYVTGSLTFEIQ